MTSPALAALAAHYSIATEFHDWQGRPTEISDDTLIAVLAALDVDAATPEAAERALAAAENAGRRLLPPTVVTRQGDAATFTAHVDDGAALEVWIELEEGGRRDVSAPSGRATTLTLPDDLPMGYHALHARGGAETAEALLVVAPRRLDLDPLLGDDRAWGFALQLYSLTSAGSWGLGDLADLDAVATWSAREGAGYVLINPLHAAQPVPPIEPSPYLPTSRRFVNPIYLRPEAVEEFARLTPAQRQDAEQRRLALQAGLERARLIDRDDVWEAKLAVLRAIFDAGRSPERQAAFDAYRDAQAAGLGDFAVWSAIAVEHGADWTAWPAELRRPDDPAVAAYAGAHRDEVDFAAWLQWQLDGQLDAVQRDAEAAGMRLGVVHDLAVGVHPCGADTWALGDVFAHGVSVGSPPDAFNQRGQDWSQPPWRPDKLAECGYAPFRAMVADILRHSGGIRVDHVMGLFRLWWVPQGRRPTEGTYVRYDAEALVGILTLEAARAGSVVVGEDLGTVEPGVRQFLAERGVLGTSILWWELDHDGDGRPLPPERWRDYCLASVTTHDLPPTAGFLASEHVELRYRLGLLTRRLADEVAADRSEREIWMRTLVDAGLLDPAALSDPSRTEEIVLALHRFLMRTPARLIGPTLTDAVGDRQTQNLPGTTDEYPNWRVPVTDPQGRLVRVEGLADAPRVARLIAVLRGH